MAWVFVPATLVALAGGVVLSPQRAEPWLVPVLEFLVAARLVIPLLIGPPLAFFAMDGLVYGGRRVLPAFCCLAGLVAAFVMAADQHERLHEITYSSRAGSEPALRWPFMPFERQPLILFRDCPGRSP